MLNDELLDAVREIQSIQSDSDGEPLTFFWNSQDLPVAAGEDRHGKKLEFGGYQMDANVTILIAREDFNDGAGPFPLAKQTGYYPGQNGTKYRIDEILNPPGSAFLTLRLVDPTG